MSAQVCIEKRKNMKKSIFSYNKRSAKTILMLMIWIMSFAFICFGDVSVVQAKARLNYSWITMTEGYSIKLKVAGTKKKAKWSSTNKKVAKVSNKGVVYGKKAGKATVTAKVGGKKLKCSVKVKKIPKKVVKVVEYKDTTFSVSEVHINLYGVTYKDEKSAISDTQNGTFTLELLNSSGSITWSSNNENIATVSNGVITAKAVGSCTVTAKCGGKTFNCPVTVTNYSSIDQVYNQRNIYIMLSLVNKDRVKAKVKPLLLKSEVTKMADIRAKEAAKVFAHTRPDGSSYKTAYGDVGFKIGSAIGENLSYNLDAASKRAKIVNMAYKNLYASTGHRQNILSRDFTYIGISSYTKEYVNQWNTTCVETYFAQEFYTK